MCKYIPTDEIYKYSSMSQQYMKGVQKWKRGYFSLWDSRRVIAILSLLFHNEEGDNLSTVQRTVGKNQK